MSRKRRPSDKTELWQIFRETFTEWQDDNASQLAAAMAFYTVFSLAPLLFIAVAIAGLMFGREAIQGEVLFYIERVTGGVGAKVVQNLLADAHAHSTVATVIGLGTLLFGASIVFAQLQDALNTIWEVTPKPERSMRLFLKKRIVSFLMVIGCGLLLLASLIAAAAISATKDILGNWFSMPSYLLEIAYFLISFVGITLLFGLLFKFLPDVKVAWSDVWIGSAFTALLFTLGKSAIGIYLGHSRMGSAYGATGSIIVLLAWIYYSAQVVFFGAEFTQVYARRYGTGVEPSDYAMRFVRHYHHQ